MRSEDLWRDARYETAREIAAEILCVIDTGRTIGFTWHAGLHEVTIQRIKALRDELGAFRAQKSEREARKQKARRTLRRQHHGSKTKEK